MPLDLAELRQRIEYAVAGIDIRCWYVYDRRWIIGSMSAESPTVGIWNTCKVCTETLRDTLSSGTNLEGVVCFLVGMRVTVA